MEVHPVGAVADIEELETCEVHLNHLYVTVGSGKPRISIALAVSV
jgi:hypothetical protein